ncbi:MAG TPA: alpha/beta hydrolase [Acidimicrobiales bacterium]|jgi:pimeloyl-ACP methyl ester carboxylesterase
MANDPVLVPSSDGVRIALHDLGGPDDEMAPVIFFSHATGFHGLVWRPMAAHLADRFRCIAIDFRGHGFSGVPEGLSMAWTGMADDVEAALDSGAFPTDRVYGVGHSMGGAALALAAARRPNAFRSLWLYEPVIMAGDPGPLGIVEGQNPMSAAAERRRERFDSLEHAYENYRSKPPLNELDPEALRAYVEGGFAPQPDGSVLLRCKPQTEAEVFRRAGGSGAGQVLDQITIPVAIVAGEPEGFGPVAFAPATAEALPNGTLIQRPQLRHFGPQEDPAGMADDLADWIARHP